MPTPLTNPWPMIGIHVHHIAKKSDIFFRRFFFVKEPRFSEKKAKKKRYSAYRTRLNRDANAGYHGWEYPNFNAREVSRETRRCMILLARRVSHKMITSVVCFVAASLSPKEAKLQLTHPRLTEKQKSDGEGRGRHSPIHPTNTQLAAPEPTTPKVARLASRFRSDSPLPPPNPTSFSSSRKSVYNVRNHVHSPYSSHICLGGRVGLGGGG